jgi:hypothetical protein
MSLKDFHAQYEGISENHSDRVSVFGTISFSRHVEQSVDNVRQSSISANVGVQADVPRHRA